MVLVIVDQLRQVGRVKPVIIHLALDPPGPFVALSTTTTTYLKMQQTETRCNMKDEAKRELQPKINKVDGSGVRTHALSREEEI
jgi:hypothetical protein